MARFVKDRSPVQGKPPGELVFIGTQKTENMALRMIEYHDEYIQETKLSSVEDLVSRQKGNATAWIDITGLHDTVAIARIGTAFGIHPLTMEDIINTGQRPKVEDFGEYLFIIVKMMRFDQTDKKIHSEQLGIIVGKDFLLTFQERPGDVFESVRERLRNHKGRIRKSGPDYLAYALLDTVVDNYLILIERLGERIEESESLIIENPGAQALSRINEYRRELHFLSSAVRPARDALRELSRLDSDLIKEGTQFFLRDLNDLAAQAVESMDTYRDMLKDHMEIHAAGTANRLNEVMKFLTVFSAVFIPLSLLAGIYGTNFDYLPELHYRYSYFIFLGALALIAAGMVFLFKRKKWL